MHLVLIGWFGCLQEKRASTFLGDMWRPSTSIMCLKYSTDFCKKENLDFLSTISWSYNPF